MRRILIYKDKQVYVVDDKISIIPSGVKPEEEYDVSKLTEEEFVKLKQNPRDKKLIKKIKELNKNGA